jgi:hypothetical protein
MEVDTEDIIRAAEGVDFGNQEEVTKFYRTFVKPTFKELLLEYRYINILSSPKTHIVNAFTNLGQTIFTAPATKLFTSEFSKIPSYYKGAFKAIPEASKLASDALKGNIRIERPDLTRMPTGNKFLMFGAPIPRALEASDVFFRTLIYQGELASGVSEEVAKKRAAYFVYRQALDPKNESGQGHLLSAIDNFTTSVYHLRKKHPLVAWFIPFVQTPMNIYKQMLEYSPIGFATIPGSAEKQRQVSKALMGTLLALGAYLALKDRTTWSVPRGKKEKELFYAAGKQPFSIKIGDTWINYSR